MSISPINAFEMSGRARPAAISLKIWSTYHVRRPTPTNIVRCESTRTSLDGHGRDLAEMIPAPERTPEEMFEKAVREQATQQDPSNTRH